ncbi:hypothetical protein [Paenibacillus sp. NPDC058177]|uniref:hypothetical protein n=1 Tax=Paenibacillus sp. NPDC058177 TaxID=3346369 RepID=UPI0036D9FCED
MSSLAKLLKWVTFLYEAFLAIPFVGGIFVVANGWTPLGIAFLLHAITIVVMMKERGPFVGNALGVITSVVALIPVVGWIMHGLTAICLFVESVMVSQRTRRY